MQLRRLAVLAIAMNSIASCGNPDKLDVMLRSRDGFGKSSGECTYWLDGPHPARYWVSERHIEATTKCVGTTVERHWVAVDGRQATSPGETGPVYFSSYLMDPVECNGRKLGLKESWFKWRIVGAGLDMQFDDGTAVAFHDERGMAVYDGSNINCSEATGQWVGTAGELKGRAGTYTSVYDSIQTVLHLVEG